MAGICLSNKRIIAAHIRYRSPATFCLNYRGVSIDHDLFRVVFILIVDRFRQITLPLSKCNHGGLPHSESPITAVITPLRTRAMSPHRTSYGRRMSQRDIAERYVRSA
ncbi:hypothetical protein BO83DRAFT_194067 [Aspergillus eucalypticola CBS 122712]|uniref:Uncharacterized protein n=1 Tax=Aspergillus eucalypticola (strain CBS 122712 / IBT 29274) TaxID=1448314 RepID=A0A317UK67_ASPEC|nr:uncharacterized protein BO83DRAFT_194067 [Aspergillus eucalypticola CBS 122712]PWY62081.1 hypothetical protein BO83DRAFT_194067 [Aspergillus eucalypticola CBS 122712]